MFENTKSAENIKDKSIGVSYESEGSQRDLNNANIVNDVLQNDQDFVTKTLSRNSHR